MIGTILNGRFSLDKELGHGGMGAVYRATDQILQRTVAIKVLKEMSGEEVGRRIRLEAQILARLVHDHIVRLYDFSADGSTYFFVMEEVDGTSFQKRFKKLPMPERVRIIAQVSEALDYAHHQGVVHRDVKPANVLLTATDQPKLSDFGLSLLIDGQPQEAGIVRGTPHYMSPEQAKGRTVDHRTDLYAVGVMLYECATLCPPFQGPVTTVMAQHVNAMPEPPRARNPEITPEFEQFILALLSKKPESRPPSGRTIAERLRDMIAREQILVKSAGATLEDLTPQRSRVADPSASAVGAGSGSASRARTPVTAMSAAASASESVGAPRPAVSPAPSPVGPRGGEAVEIASSMLARVEAEPILVSPDERYLCGHYLAYLLGGSRRRGFLRRRPLDPLNADRARLLLAMTALMTGEEDKGALSRAAILLDRRPDVRPLLNPIVVVKYLASRDTPAKRKRFRQVRMQLQQASEYAAEHLTDAQGVLNPGLMPQVLTDLRRLAPERTELDDMLVQRWNRVTEVWRANPEFREAVLRYATTRAWRDPASLDLWPEVVYPLIERARWQRRLRSGTEAVLDYVCEKIHLPDAGVRMDRAFRQAVPEQVVAQLDIASDAFTEDPTLEEAAAPEPESKSVLHAHISPASFHDLEVEDSPTRDLMRLVQPDPLIRVTTGELATLWREAIARLKAQDRSPPRTIPLGPYRLAVVATIRARNAGQVAIQGMVNKQIELLTPSFTGSAAASRPVVAAWLHRNNSLVVSYLDHLGNQRYVLWDASTSQQTNFDSAADLNHTLLALGLESPHQVERALTKRYRPSNPV